MAKKLIAEIYLTRLPVGHTHEDIDGLFGHIWTWFRKESCHTLEDYRVGVLECFKDSVVNLDIQDLYITPNDGEFLAPQFDSVDLWAKQNSQLTNGISRQCLQISTFQWVFVPFIEIMSAIK